MNAITIRAISKIAAIGVLFAAAQGAAADTPQDRLTETQVFSQKVNVEDIDFSNPADVQAAYKRIKIAARRVCTRGTDRTIGVQRYSQIASCQKEAVENAVLSAETPQLTALHRGTSERLAASR